MKPFHLFFAAFSSWPPPRAYRADLASIENQYRAAYELHVGTKHAADVADLDAKYIGALERAMASATQGQRLDEAPGLRDEIQRVNDKQPLPEKDDGVDPAVAKFRGTYRAQLAKLNEARLKAAAPIIERFERRPGCASGGIDQSGQTGRGLPGEGLPGGQPRGKAGGSRRRREPDRRRRPAPEKPFENSLGMRFVPVPIIGGPSEGKTIRFSVWETRVKDFAAFVKDEKRDWPKPDFAQGDDHPAVNVSWEDATAFCAWLTKEERRKRKIGPKDVYRLPTGP